MCFFDDFNYRTVSWGSSVQSIMPVLFGIQAIESYYNCIAIVGYTILAHPRQQKESP
jgi:hypothetical protein